MIHREPKMIEVAGFTVAGLSVRTLNRDEFNPDTAKLPVFWEHYVSSGQAEKTANRLPDSPIYGVYSDYESDANGFYTVTAGVQITQEATESGLDVIAIQKGNYLYFEATGPIPEVLISTWGRIWDYFEDNPMYRRSFNTDYELYLGPEYIAVCIGVNNEMVKAKK